MTSFIMGRRRRLLFREQVNIAKNRDKLKTAESLRNPGVFVKQHIFSVN